MFYRRDPVCGARVNRDTEHILQYDGKTYCFDSQACMETFKECPHRFLKKRTIKGFFSWLAKGSKDVPKSCHEMKK